MCLIVTISLKLLKHFKWNILKVSERFEDSHLTEMFISIYLENLTNMTSSIIINVYFLIYITFLSELYKDNTLIKSRNTHITKLILNLCQ